MQNINNLEDLNKIVSNIVNFDDLIYITVYNNNKNIIDALLKKNNMNIKIHEDKIYTEDSKAVLSHLKLNKGLVKFFNILQKKTDDLDFTNILYSSYLSNECYELPGLILLNLEISRLKENNDILIKELNKSILLNKELFNEFYNFKRHFLNDKERINNMSDRLILLENKIEQPKLIRNKSNDFEDILKDYK
jgi:hypothetical protein